MNTETKRVRIALVALFTLMLPALMSVDPEQALLTIAVSTALAAVAIGAIHNVGSFALVRARSTAARDAYDGPHHLTARVTDPVCSPRRPRAPEQD
ncbi:hypothetical protein FB381_0344 [Nocardioides albertanoniae]|uniref:Uncharacterized protein n=1 Tax=Nocardioides albertanoniae TaxID=1175486 RepID=A0A543A1M3_9ACTN|nr:hypothetical protein [Nocardioides albertanoniae]TQL66482.1 hypothetical protein FB381_0344 [Nocardioides albertanoniae]